MPKSSNRTWPSARDENVAGLQVAVHDQPRVRVGDRRGHLQQQPEPVARSATPAAGSTRRWLAIDVLHREVGPALPVDAGVVQARDVRMFE